MIISTALVTMAIMLYNVVAVAEGNIFACHHWTESDERWKISQGGNYQGMCERHAGYIYTLGDDSQAPGCGGCWCCKPVSGTVAVRYDISATIADEEHAGTTLDVYVQIIGAAGSTEELRCPSGTFDRDLGTTVTCSVTSDVDIGQYTCVTWRLSGSDGLYIAQFTTIIDTVAQSTITPADGWLDELDGSSNSRGSNGQTATWCIEDGAGLGAGYVGEGTLTLTCDNQVKAVYVDGVLQELPPSAMSWDSTSELTVPDNVRVLAVECLDTGAYRGMLAAFIQSTGEAVVTDSSWTCSSMYAEGWGGVNFVEDPNHWEYATQIGQNGGEDGPPSQWDEMRAIPESAFWIWTGDYDPNEGIADDRVYCRWTPTSMTGGMITEVPFLPTKGPLPTQEPFNGYTNEDVIDNKNITLVESDDGIGEWEIVVDEPIPYKVLSEILDRDDTKATDTPLGYLAFAGYLDYTLDTAKASDSTEAGSGSNKERTVLQKEDLKAAAQNFLRFNGYVEGESVTDEMVSYMKKPRCGNADMEFSDDEDDCVTIHSHADIAKEITYSNQEFVSNTEAFILPGDNGLLVADASSYFYEVDVKYAQLQNKRSKAIFLGFNYHEVAANGASTPLEVIAMRFIKEKLCAQFLILHQGSLETSLASRDTVLNSCLTPTKNELIRRTFKIRLDVYKALPGILGKVYVTVRGEDVGQNVYKTAINSAVVTMSRDDHTLTLARLCKRSQPTIPSRLKRSTRSKRFALSNYLWDVDTIRFNFQNYSSTLHQDGTRQGVLGAIELYSKETGLTFTEVGATSAAELVFMFIKGRHADGKSFNTAGAEKAHAFSPVHSEVHFNDYEDFQLNKQSKTSTSIFYVAAHEIGHALGIKHSEKREALMHAGYDTASAFKFASLHSDDVNAINMMYQGAGEGSMEQLTNDLERAGTYTPGTYTPKTPFPRECHNKTDAALNIGGKVYLISGPFVWRLTGPNTNYVVDDGFPKRVTDVFAQATGTVQAMFSSADSKKVFVLHDTSISIYKFNSRFGFIIAAGGKEVSDVLAAGGNSVTKPIKAAFTLDEKSYLITKDMQYYEITWKKSTPLTVTLHQQNAVSALLGRAPGVEMFNAAMTYSREFMKEGKAAVTEVYNFGKRIVFTEKVLSNDPRGADKLHFQEIPEMFRLAGWCPAANV